MDHLLIETPGHWSGGFVVSGARSLTYAHVMVLPVMMKQLVVKVDSVTTIVCLDAAGQIREVDEPFETLNGLFMHPPFHVHCRTVVVPYVAGLVTDQRDAANEELQRRPRKKRRPSTVGNPPPARGFPPMSGTQIRAAARRRAERRGRLKQAWRAGPSNEGQKVDVGDDVRRSRRLRTVASDPAAFRPTSAGGDPVAAVLASQLGADDLPQVVADLEALPDSQLLERMVRYTDAANELVSGPYIPRLGVFGAGIVFLILVAGDDEERLVAYGRVRVEAVLDPEAEVIDLEVLRELQAEALADLADEPATAERERWRRVISDEGRFALLLGYDAIRVTHADGTVEIVVVDRGALIVEEP